MTRTLGTPIVFERREQKKRRSDGDHVEHHLHKAASRTADAMAKGVRRYEKERKRSEKRSDGAVIDMLPNIATGMSATASRLAPVPFDVLRAGWTPSVRRAVRRTVRLSRR